MAAQKLYGVNQAPWRNAASPAQTIGRQAAMPPESSMFRIVPGHTSQHVNAVRTLFREYAAELAVDLCFQSFEAELAELPGKYAPPAGCLLVALAGEEYAGCVALRPHSPETCEMKRLYVRPAQRRSGLGRQLAVVIIEAARTIGYRRMVLDTLWRLAPALALYRDLGFVEVAPYYLNPLPEVVYMALNLEVQNPVPGPP
jgi:putative acetyltransferase